MSTPTNTPDINEPLDLSDDPRPTDFNDMPEARAAFRPMQQPGTYIFQTPAEIEDKQFSQKQVPNQGPTLFLSFREDKGLKNLSTGEQFDTQINNMTYERGKKGEKKKGDDIAYLIKACGGMLPPGAGNKTYAGEVKRVCGGKKFRADVVISAKCNPQNDVYVGGQQVKGRKGCGQKFDMRAYQINQGPNAGKQVLAIARSKDGVWAEGAQCPCGAEVRAFANLANIRSAE